MPYTIDVLRTAQRELTALPKNVQIEIAEKIDELVARLFEVPVA